MNYFWIVEKSRIEKEFKWSSLRLTVKLTSVRVTKHIISDRYANPVLECDGSWRKKLQSQQNLLFQEYFDTWRALASISVTVGSVIQGSRDSLLWHQHFTVLGTDFKEKQHRCHVSVMESHEKLNIKGRTVSLLKYLLLITDFSETGNAIG